MEPAREERKNSAKRVRAFCIVGIGASAGGLDALKEFLLHTPPDGNLAYVVISHLAPDYKSITSQLLQKHTSMRVSEAEDGMQVRPNCVYVVPPGKEMSLLRGGFQLIAPAREREVKNPIDFFFRSLANDQGAYGIGVIFSGTGTDGLQGIKDIKDEDGLVIIQEPADAPYTGMPLGAAETGMADFVLPVKDMPRVIIEYTRNIANLRLPSLQNADAETADLLKKIFVLIRNEVGLDFTLYKPGHLVRGIQKQMSLHRIADTGDYIRFLRANPEEVARLSRALLVKVTRFFRDQSAFDTLKRKALPLITKGKDMKNPLRIWVPGCSTGEEAYSLAIILREYMDEIQERFAVQIFATDLDNDFIEASRAGVYPSGIAEDVTASRLDRFFDRAGLNYRIKDDIRSIVIFATQDLVKGPTFMRLDLISCRNVLIYMGPQLQRKLISLFHYCLNPGGILFLGSSESIGGFSDLFSSLDNKARIFHASPVQSPPLPKSMRAIQISEMPGSPPASEPAAHGEESAGALLDRLLQHVSANPYGGALAGRLRDALSALADGGDATAGKKEAAPTSDAAMKKTSRERNSARLMAELKETRERLQATIEELETSNEELRSTNEELEPVNEELLTLNAEYQNKVDELADARATMDILLAGAQITTIFIGTNLAIRSFTPSIAGIVNLVASDIGRNLRDFSSYLDYPEMIADLENVIATGRPKERAIRHENGRWYLIRILPYRKKGRIDGAAITCIDITEQKQALQKAQDVLAYATGIIETIREPLIVLDAGFRIITVNHAFYRTFMVTRGETEGRLLFELGNGQWDIPALRQLLCDILPKHTKFEGFQVEHEFPAIGRRRMMLNARQIMQAGEGTQTILLAMEDVTKNGA